MKIQIEKSRDFEVLAKLNKSVQSLHQKLYPDEFKKFDLKSVSKEFERIMSTPESYSFIAKKDSEPIGYVLCIIKNRRENAFQFAKTVLYIDQILVEEKNRNQGVAQQLLTHVINLAKDLHIDEIQLDHWNKNEDAKVFFSAKGFEYFNYKMKINTNANTM